MERPTLQRLASGRALILSLVALAAFSMLARILLGTSAHAPTVFNDELGYTKLAQSIGMHGRFALLNREGFSYSPLFPLLISPIYALGASGPTAYALIKIVNAILISLAVFPLYRVARFALAPDRSLLVAAVGVFAPLMSYPAWTMSESLAYPLCLVGLWAMLAAVREPSPWRDAVLLVAIGFATVARIQLIVLLPAALTACVLAALLGGEGGVGRRLFRGFRTHWLIFGLTAAAVLAAGARALSGGSVYAAFGRYANVGEKGLPDGSRFLDLAVHHLAGLDLAVGVVPFVAAVVATFAFVRARCPFQYVPFAAVAVSFTAWLLLQVAANAAVFDAPGFDVPRIHERFLIYAVPLFLVALLATVGLPATRVGERAYLVAVAIAAALPLLIPFDRYVNITNGIDTFSFLPFGRWTGERYEAVPLARFAAAVVAVTFGLTYVRMLRGSLARTSLYAIVVFAVVSAFVWSRLNAASAVGRSVLPQRADWVDHARSTGEVSLLADERSLAALETTYFNLSISRLFTLCEKTVGGEFGEQNVEIDAARRVHAEEEPVTARLAVVPDRFGFRGRILARNIYGGQVLLQPDGGRLVASAPERDCG